MFGGLPEEVILGQGPEQEKEPAMQISEGSVCGRRGAACAKALWWAGDILR